LPPFPFVAPIVPLFPPLKLNILPAHPFFSLVSLELGVGLELGCWTVGEREKRSSPLLPCALEEVEIETGLDMIDGEIEPLARETERERTEPDVDSRMVRKKPRREGLRDGCC
jgi:hypothetical protein